MPVAEIQRSLEDIPEIRALRRVAVSLNARFALRGGVVRNMMFRHGRWRDSAPSLYDFVDPFADINVLVEDARVWSELRQKITTSLPFAPFFDWHGETRKDAIAHLARYGNIAADRFTIPRCGGRTVNIPSVSVAP